MDPVTGGIALIVGNFLGGVGGRLIERWIPSSSDKASLQIRREEIRLRQEQLLTQIAEARSLKMMEIEARQKEYTNQHRLQNWPLRLQADDFLEASKAQNGCALNVILCIVDTRDGDFYKNTEEGKAINHAIDTLNGVPLSFSKEILNQFGNDVLFYCQTIKNSSLSGHSLRTTLWNTLQTEPTILIEASIPKKDYFVFHVSHWGSAFEAAFGSKIPAVSHKPLIIDLAQIAPNGGTQYYTALSVGLSGIVVALADAFRALQRPHVLSGPVLPSLMANTGTMVDISPSLWQPMTNSYLSIYDMVATSTGSTMIASELAAHAAITSHENKIPDFAVALLDKALELHPQLADKSTSDEKMNAVFHQQRFRSGQHSAVSELEKAMSKIRGWQINNTSHKNSLRPPIRERARLNKTNL